LLQKLSDKGDNIMSRGTLGDERDAVGSTKNN